MTVKAKTNSSEQLTASGPNLFVALGILTIIAGGSGAGFAAIWLKMEPTQSIGVLKPVEPQHEAVLSAPSRFPSDAIEVALDPIITSFGPDEKSKVRLEISMISSKAAASSAVLKKELVEDIIAFVKGSSMEDISGARGFQNLREDLDDRARIRGRGNIFGLLIGGFVVE